MRRFLKLAAVMVCLALCLQAAVLPVTADELDEADDYIVTLADSGIIAGGYCGDEGDGTNLSWTLTEDGTLTISGRGGMQKYCAFDGRKDQIKSVIISYGVTGIVDSAFSGCTFLTSISIPNSVTSIGRSAFSGCYAMTSITIPDSVTSIGDKAFLYCPSLTSITVDSANPAYCSVDGVLFSKDKSLLLAYPEGKKDSSYIIPDGVSSIGEAAFMNCRYLTSVTVPKSVTSIGNSAFYECEVLTSVTIPNGVTRIGLRAFENCFSLTSVTIPGSVTYIGSEAFRSCAGLTSVTISDGVTSVGDFMFYGCGSLISVTIPNSVTSIGDWAFSVCTALPSVVIPRSVTSIGFGAFYDCPALTSVFIPKSVISIGSYAFSGCTRLANIYCEAPEQPAEWSIIWNENCPASVWWNYKLLYGDLDRNGIVRESEAVKILDMIKGKDYLTPDQQMMADANSDGIIDIRDFNYIYNKSLSN